MPGVRYEANFLLLPNDSPIVPASFIKKSIFDMAILDAAFILYHIPYVGGSIHGLSILFQLVHLSTHTSLPHCSTLGAPQRV